MNWSILFGFVLMGLVIAIGWFIGMKALLGFVGIIVIIFGLIALMMYAYWYLFVRKENG